LGLQEKPQLVLMLQDVAWFEIDGVNFHGWLCRKPTWGFIGLSTSLGTPGKAECTNGLRSREVLMTGSWWRPDRLAQRRDNLAVRGRILAAARNLFFADHYVEVGTPALQASPGLEPHPNAFASPLHDPRDRSARPRYLPT